MAFTAQDVKKLREMTNCGMMDCKKALTETDGDMDKAVEFLREKGLATAAKKAGRIASEGLVEAVVFEDGTAVAVEVNSETDFVAKNVDFQNFVHAITEVIAKENPADVEALKEMKINDSQTVGEALTEK
ncbi:MAG: translation elongation factor Ts, partial [Acutalibacteraceae bacterium]|nr:translation elongation factor Ts [Acutalibacteraceae bacterium]